MIKQLNLKQLKKTRKYFLKFAAILLILPFFVFTFFDVVNYNYSPIFIKIAYVVFAINIFFLAILYFIEKNKLHFLALIIAAMASVFCLIFSPTFAMRSCFLYIFILMLMIGVVFNNEFASLKRLDFITTAEFIILCLMCCYSITNFKKTYSGYEENFAINKWNNEALKKYNRTDKSIYLIKCRNNTYRSSMPYDAGTEFIAYWMREYYNIPHNVALEWHDIEEYIKAEEDRSANIIFDDGFFEAEENYRFSKNKCNLLIDSIAEKDTNYKLKTKVKTGWPEFAKLEIYLNDILLETYDISDNATDINLPLSLQHGTNIITFKTNAKRIDSGKDTRELYLWFGETSLKKEY